MATAARCGSARPGWAWLGEAGQGLARPGKARLGSAWRGKGANGP